MPIPAKIKNYLIKKKLKFEIVKHKTVYTAYDLAQTTRSRLEQIGKTLFVKADRDYYLILLPGHRRLNIPKLKKILKAKKISIVKEKEMAKKLKIKPGAITPFGSLYKLGVVVDKSLAGVTEALFGAGSFTESLRFKIKDYLKTEEPLKGDIGENAGLKIQAKPVRKKKNIKRKK